MRAASSRCCTAWACEVALDDFGSGLSSFSTLKTLPIDYLKIDGSFIRNLSPRTTVNQAMVAAMIELSRSLNFRVVAEQVEDQLSLDAVKRMGIDFRPRLRDCPAAAPVGNADPLLIDCGRGLDTLGWRSGPAARCPGLAARGSVPAYNRLAGAHNKLLWYLTRA